MRVLGRIKSKPLEINSSSESLAIQAFQRAARSVPAYRQILSEGGILADQIQSPSDFQRVPFVDKHNTFRRFPLEQLCVGGVVGELESVLTSSGHSGVFAFGLNDKGQRAFAVDWTDGLLDRMFAVRSHKTLLVNCLPMGVKINTHACTLAETSVRPDMALALVKTFQTHFEQFVIVGDPCFVKHLLETGQDMGLDWPSYRVNLILGEEPLAENTRIYFEAILGIQTGRGQGGDERVVSSMGIGEVGLNLFFEVPAIAPLIRLRRLLHEDEHARDIVLGSRKNVPSLFTYDPNRIFVEFDELGRLVLTTLDPNAMIPLIRYLPGDSGAFLNLPERLRPKIEAAGLDWSSFEKQSIVTIEGRSRPKGGRGAEVSPESVKEGLYQNHGLARKTTANFRIAPTQNGTTIRIQLALGILPDPALSREFFNALSRYIEDRFDVVCEGYWQFQSGMGVDYERKFDYRGA